MNTIWNETPDPGPEFDRLMVLDTDTGAIQLKEGCSAPQLEQVIVQTASALYQQLKENRQLLQAAAQTNNAILHLYESLSPSQRLLLRQHLPLPAQEFIGKWLANDPQAREAINAFRQHLSKDTN